MLKLKTFIFSPSGALFALALSLLAAVLLQTGMFSANPGFDGAALFILALVWGGIALLVGF